MFGDYITDQGYILQVDKEYTFTISKPWYAITFNAGYVKDALDKFLNEYNYGRVSAVSRSLFSEDYYVTVIPANAVPQSYWVMGLQGALGEISWGFGDAIIGNLQMGAVQSSIAGDVGSTIGSSVGSAVASALKSTWPFLAGALAIYFVVSKIDVKSSRRKS